MVNYAVGIGATIGAGLALVVPEVFRSNPSKPLVAIGPLLFVIGLVAWSDLIADLHTARSRRRGR